jgi:GGDEF domain-containing protein
MRRALWRLLPGALLLLAATALLRLPLLADALAVLLPASPYAVFGGGLVLAWWFGRSRLGLTLLVLALAERGLAHSPAALEAAALLLPLNLTALAWLRERRLFTASGLARLALILAQALLVAALGRAELPGARAWLEAPIVEGLGPRRLGLPQPALAAFLLAGLLAALRLVRRPVAIEAGSLWALVAAFLALAGDPATPALTLYLATAGLVQVAALLETWHGLAFEDALTGLPARRALEESLARLGGRYAIAMVDIDHFKRFNDEYGHDVGDQLLRMVGARLAAIGGGRAFRYGGEEFAVLFPGRSAEEAVPHLEAFRRGLEGSPFTVRGPWRPRGRPARPRPGAGRKKVTVTVSIGVADADAGAPPPREVIRAADQALYRAKRAGRNRLAR